MLYMNSHGFQHILHEFARIKYMLNLHFWTLLKSSDPKIKWPEVFKIVLVKLFGLNVFIWYPMSVVIFFLVLKTLRQMNDIPKLILNPHPYIKKRTPLGLVSEAP